MTTLYDTHTPYKAADFIKKHIADRKPKIGIVLGSGLGDFPQHLENTINIPYEEIPGFPTLSVHGHTPRLVIGTLAGVDVVCLQGRAHTYEGMDNYDRVKTYVRTLKCLGCEYFIATNASGSLCEHIGPGELMLVTDHINLQPSNPMIGPNDDDFGPRFYPLDNAYNHKVRECFLRLAKSENIMLHQGVYCSVLGPHYETAAEIRAMRVLGADAVGMSTVPEVLVANHCGLKVAVIAIISNLATGLAKEAHAHENVVAVAKNAASKLNRLLARFIENLPS